MFNVCPYRPAGFGPGGMHRDQWRVAREISFARLILNASLTGVQKVERIIKTVPVVHLRIAPKDNEGISN